ncbi:MAG: hypothetical protein ACRBBS_16960 [Thalassovita sp.]
MKAVRHAISVLMMTVLCFSLGLGSAAHALSTGCIGGHCDGGADVSVDNHHIGHTPFMMAKEVLQDSDSAATDGCSPLLCNVLLLNSERSVAEFDQTETILAWQIKQLSPLEEPETPDRPPNP